MTEQKTYEFMENRIKELKKENELLKTELNECKLIMETLHDSEQQMYAMVSCVPGAVYRYDINPEKNLIYMSDEISNITGYPASHFMFNRVISYPSIIHADDIDYVESTINKKIEENDIKPFIIEYRIIDEKNDIRWCSEKGRVLYSNNGDPLYIDGTIFDITDRKLAQEGLQKANIKLKRLASIDALTGIANRRYLIEHLKVEWKRVKREKDYISIILSDIDYFKAFNDNYGHQEGDKCLYAVAQKIKSSLKRPADLVSRFGGEEFIIILPSTGVEGAAHVAERIKTKILELNIPHKFSTAAQCVSLSLGVASSIPKPSSDPESLIKAADNALYQAKRQGRNQVSVHNVVSKF